MTKVLLLIKGLGRGGAEQILASSASYLDRSRFEYEVAYLLPWKDALVDELRAAGLPVHCLNGARGPAWIGRLRTLVQRRRIDLIHSHSPVAAVGARLAFPTRRPIRVYTEHNVWERYHRVTYWANLLTFSRSAHVFAVSDHVRESIRYPAPVGRVLHMPPLETLYHGIDPTAVHGWSEPDGVRSELGIDEDVPLVGTVANFKAHKRLDLLLRVASKVRDEIPTVRFVVVGQGPLEAQIRAEAQSLGLSRTVLFTGFREDAPRVTSSFDVFVLTSEYEGLSIAVIEALALGKPVVVTRVGGLPEVVEDGRQGFIVAPNDTEAFAERVVQILRDPQLHSRMSVEARSRAAEFDIKHSVSRMEQVYEELVLA